MSEEVYFEINENIRLQAMDYGIIIIDDDAFENELIHWDDVDKFIEGFQLLKEQRGNDD